MPSAGRIELSELKIAFGADSVELLAAWDSDSNKTLDIDEFVDGIMVQMKGKQVVTALMSSFAAAAAGCSRTVLLDWCISGERQLS